MSPAASPLTRRLEQLCLAFAWLGGAALMAAMAVIVISVTGAQFGHPVLGDTEIVDQLTGVLVFCFLPYCHFRGGNILVDFFTKPLSQRAVNGLDAFMNLLFAVVAAVLAWRLAAGGISAYERDQRSMFLGLPEWRVYAIGVVAMLLWIVVIVHSAWLAVGRARGTAPPEAGAPQSFG
ncbi:MAG: hypothetical protein AMXMBFR66_02280 [Pseudomonadota bacterium]|nr:TRAP transporter small permease [Rubrivivax sp.]NLZ42659.1 TRAP transporter small permease [Comamonadaceae bacterium]